MLTSPNKQKGSLLVISLVVILVLGGFALTLNRLLTRSSDALVYEVYGVRALMTAQAGIDVQLSRIFPRALDGTPVASNCSALTIAAIPGLDRCQVTTLCSAAQYQPQPGNTVNYYRVQAQSRCSVGDVQVSRRLSVDASDGAL